MEEEHGLHQLLDEVGPIVATPQVGQFVKDHVLQVLGGHLVGQPRWNNYSRPQEADGRRHLESRRNQDGHGTPSLELIDDPLQLGPKRPGIDFRTPEAKPANLPQTDKQTSHARASHYNPAAKYD